MQRKKRAQQRHQERKVQRLNHGRIYMNNATILISTTHVLSLYMCTNFIFFDIALSLGEEKDEY